jgi:hypothetical protein
MALWRAVNHYKNYHPRQSKGEERCGVMDERIVGGLGIAVPTAPKQRNGGNSETDPSHRKTPTVAGDTGVKDGNDKPVRIQLLLPPQSVTRLEALRKMTEAASSSEVIRNAIRVYEGLAREVHNGNTILIKEPDGTLSQIRIF